MKNISKFLVCFLIFLFISEALFSQKEITKIEANWQSINKRPYPQWFKDAKLGIFIHWGIYSVPSYCDSEQYAEWFLRGLQSDDTGRINFQKRVFGENFEYKDYAPLFKAELWNPDEWAELFKNSGAKYVLLVSKHHDGYCLWPSKYSPNWNSKDIGPKRDLVGELSNSVRKSGLKMGLYYSLPEWNNPLHIWYKDNAREIGKYVEKHMIPQFKELIYKYKPSLIFSDGEWLNSAEEWHSAELISWYYNLVGEEAIVNNRWGGGSNTGFLTPEYSAGINITDRPWAECRGLGRSFGLNRNEKLEAYMSPAELIHFFANAVAAGGGITLNVGPKADGQIPLIQQERLLQLGEWLKVNGEAIYSSTAWKKTREEKLVKIHRIDKEIDFNWVRNSPGNPIREDNFTASWTGYIQAEQSAKYKFEALADDGIRVSIDDKLIIDNWKKPEDKNADGNVMENNSANKKEGFIKLKKGKKYFISIDYFEKTQNAEAHLYWSSNKVEKEIVPQKCLFSSIEKEKGDGLKVEYSSMKEYLVYTQNKGNVYAIMLEWPGKELIISLEEKPGENMKVSMLGLNKNLSWKFENKKLIIDLSEIGYNDMPCKYAWTIKLEGLAK